MVAAGLDRASARGSSAAPPRTVPSAAPALVRPKPLPARNLDELQPPEDIAFLGRHGVPTNILALATRLAAIRGTHASRELLASGFSQAIYWSALAQDLGLDFLRDLGGVELPAGARQDPESGRIANSALVIAGGRKLLAIAPQPAEIPLLRARLTSSPAVRAQIMVVEPAALRDFLVRKSQDALVHRAVGALARRWPRLSARRAENPSDVGAGPILLSGATLASLIAAPEAAIGVIGAALSFCFFNCVAWKLAAACMPLREVRCEWLPDSLLPTYSVLVPLYREASVVPELVRHLSAIRYPASKLQILLIAEADDQDTVTAIRRHATAPVLTTILVPPCAPRTKPKALSYALAFVGGDYVVVYDAEDRPEPDQLRRVAAAFRDRAELGCIQARLTPDNSGNWLARMFTIEYAANFDVLLPALARCGVPLPLGGTSNHFPRAVLDRVGGWDPFNVTEDADLGIRLARFGYRSATIASRTYEEAPIGLRQWLAQRRRWIKGWIQTAMICMPGRVPRSLGLSFRDLLAVHGILSAGIIGLLLYPLTLVALGLAAEALFVRDLARSPLAWILLVLSTCNLVLILLAAAISAWRGLGAIGARRLAVLIPTLPIYWALMSFAAWQALFQFLKRPSEWEKTPHGLARDRRTPLDLSPAPQVPLAPPRTRASRSRKALA